MADRPKCQTCIYWGDPDRSSPTGLCRRNAPETALDRTTSRPSWPETYMGSWCGEWRDAAGETFVRRMMMIEMDRRLAESAPMLGEVP